MQMQHLQIYYTTTLRQPGSLPRPFQAKRHPACARVQCRSTGDGAQQSSPSASSDAASTAAAYTVLSITSASLAAVALAVPDLLLTALLPSSAALDPIFLRIAGSTLLISAAAEWCLQVRLRLCMAHALPVACSRVLCTPQLTSLRCAASAGCSCKWPPILWNVPETGPCMLCEVNRLPCCFCAGKWTCSSCSYLRWLMHRAHLLV